MGDQKIRELQRAALAGDVGVCDRLIKELERAGRADEVIPTLMLLRDDEDTRARLGVRWRSHAISGSQDCDVPFVSSEPLVRWQTKLRGRDPIQSLHASPLGLVAFTSRRVVVLDPTTGEERYTLDQKPHYLAVDGDVLLSVSGKRVLVGRDLWTGEVLHETKLGGRAAMSSYGDGVFLNGNFDRVDAYTLSDPRRPPEPAWQRKGDFDAHVFRRIWSRANRIVISDGRQDVLLDAASGEEQLRIGYEGTCGLDHELMLVWEEEGLACLELDSRRRRWLVEGGDRVLGLRRHSVVVQHEEDRRIVALDRRTGRVRAEITGDCHRAFWTARYVAYTLRWVQHQGVVAVQALGLPHGILWEIPLQKPLQTFSIAPGWGCLFTATPLQLTCYESSAP